MPATTDRLTLRLLSLLCEVQTGLGLGPSPSDDPDVRFADALDSMGMVEFLAVAAGVLGVEPARIEECVGRHFTTVGRLAAALQDAGLSPRDDRPTTTALGRGERDTAPVLVSWLAATAVRLPATFESADVLDVRLGRPAGWWHAHTGNAGRRLWNAEDPLEKAVLVGHEALSQAELSAKAVGALVVTSEAPPLPVGLAAALHHGLGLGDGVPAWDVGGACCGFLAALALARLALPHHGPVLLLAVEAPSRWLAVGPGPQGEAAALFGDAVAAAVVCDRPLGRHPVPLTDVLLGADGRGRELIRVELSATGAALVMDGRALAGQAVTAMANAVARILARHGVLTGGLEAVVAHGGNGRMPPLLARRLGLPATRLLSETARTGNLGSASLPAAWVASGPPPSGPVAWVAAGAGLTWAAALTGVDW